MLETRLRPGGSPQSDVEWAVVRDEFECSSPFRLAVTPTFHGLRGLLALDMQNDLARVESLPLGQRPRCLGADNLRSNAYVCVKTG